MSIPGIVIRQMPFNPAPEVPAMPDSSKTPVAAIVVMQRGYPRAVEEERLSVDHDLRVVTEGYDVVLWRTPDPNETDLDCQEEPELSNADMQRIADMMIDRWTRFKESLR